jgi:hypothetical protein
LPYQCGLSLKLWANPEKQVPIVVRVSSYLKAKRTLEIKNFLLVFLKVIYKRYQDRFLQPLRIASKTLNHSKKSLKNQKSKALAN